MKKRLTVLLVAFVMVMQVFCINVSEAYALETADITSNEALVVDINTDEILFSKDTEPGSVQIASLTKIMTYVLAIENIDDLNIKIEVPAGTEQDVINNGASNAGLEDGYEYTVLDLLYGLMLPSGCDAADVLAKYIGNGDYSAFIDMMNDKAAELGMNDTVFYSASGLEYEGKNNLSTEQDLYKLAIYAFDKPYFREIIGTEFYQVTGTDDGNTDSTTVRNTNYMMGEYNGAEYYYIYSLGGKTGHKSAAGRCLISFAQKGDLEVVAITLGVPGNSNNYHLTDHRKLFDYVFEEFTENITIDIGTEYKSVDIGEKIQIEPLTSADTKITWMSSDESVATVNEYGVVTGKKLGQAKITAVTETGNKDYAYVSVGFYNGVDVKYSSGPSDSEGKLGYGEIDWSIIKNAGMDFAIIRAGYAAGNNPDDDPYFVENIEGAFENDINIMISFDGYATNESYAEAEAEYLVKYMEESIPDYVEKVELPIVYNLYEKYTSTYIDPEELSNIIYAFKNKMAEHGYDVMVELGKTRMSAMDLSKITGDKIDLYIVYRPYVPDYKTRMTAVNGDKEYNADIWQYRSDGYFGSIGIAKTIKMSAMYMDYTELDTIHEKYDDELYPEKPEISVEGEYTYTGENIEANVEGFDPETMEIEGNIAKNAGAYTVTVKPLIKWKDGSSEPVSAQWEIQKADPEFDSPELKAEKGTALNNVPLPENFYWKDGTEKVGSSEDNRYSAVYVPEDTDNYNCMDIELTVEILNTGIVKSGDYFNLIHWMIIMAVSMLIMVVMFALRRYPVKK